MIIRKAKSDDWKGIARVHVDCMHTAYQGVLPPEILDKFTYDNREKRWKNDLPKAIRRGTMTYVVEDQQGAIVGFALGGTMRDPRLRIRYIGEVYGIYVHPQVQNEGIGKKLLESVAEYFSTLDFPTMALWTIKELPSCPIFEKLGAENVYEKKTVIGGKTLEEIAYGWEDLKSFSSKKEGLN
ncbi:GNAT family N-acetyltransferase [Evansella tamaricis]|uniref:GNAT family N-acetyltransferase n=1 Tax=Evansella tamaricis TaxID=2069301 RepID=A0ABS6JIM5_9BACI|nr:GNAT family N-acetyltransferase [Evansella tamaricis]MBU9713049.1 GNAT family N-acetyltransferase [Evansella tamaricis]